MSTFVKNLKITVHLRVCVGHGAFPLSHSFLPLPQPHPVVVIISMRFVASCSAAGFHMAILLLFFIILADSFFLFKKRKAQIFINVFDGLLIAEGIIDKVILYNQRWRKFSVLSSVVSLTCTLNCFRDRTKVCTSENLIPHRTFLYTTKRDDKMRCALQTLL